MQPPFFWRKCVCVVKPVAARVGFEPTGAHRTVGFQDRSHQPLSHLAVYLYHITCEFSAQAKILKL